MNSIQAFHGINFSINDDLELYRAKSLLEKEPETIAWLELWSRRNLDDQLVFFDIGANIGCYSLYLASLIGIKADIFAFEPESKNYMSLIKNITNNDGFNIAALRLALGSDTGLARLLVNDQRPGNSGSQALPMHKAAEKHGIICEETVLSISLDRLIKDFKLPIPNIVKIDVDGIEASILDGASASLEAGGIEGLMIEFNDELESQRYSKILLDKGFNPHSDINNLANHSNVRRAKDKQNTARNVAFIKSLSQ